MTAAEQSLAFVPSHKTVYNPPGRPTSTTEEKQPEISPDFLIPKESNSLQLAPTNEQKPREIDSVLTEMKLKHTHTDPRRGHKAGISSGDLWVPAPNDPKTGTRPPTKLSRESTIVHGSAESIADNSVVDDATRERFSGPAPTKVVKITSDKAREERKVQVTAFSSPDDIVLTGQKGPDDAILHLGTNHFE